MIAKNFFLLFFGLYTLFNNPTLANVGLNDRPSNTTCIAPSPLVVDELITSERAFPLLKFTKGIQLKQPPNDPDTWYVVERDGVVVAFNNDENATTKTVVLDISDRVNLFQNGGLQSLAFHPQYPTDGRIFVSYTGPSGDTTLPVANYVSSFISNDGGLTFDSSSEQIILKLNTKNAVHAWGTVDFGSDGNLYVGTGDGTFAAEAQNTNNWLGSILRVDIDSATPYAIPSDNPFSSGGGAPEIFAWGFRNPFVGRLMIKGGFGWVTSDIMIGKK